MDVKPEKMTDEELAEAYRLLLSGNAESRRVAAEQVAAHIAALTAERDAALAKVTRAEANHAAIQGSLTETRVERDALRERVQALEHDVKGYGELMLLLGDAMGMGSVTGMALVERARRLVKARDAMDRERNEAALRMEAAESRLSGILQWARADPTTPDAEWWEGYGDAQLEVRGLLGEDAPKAGGCVWNQCTAASNDCLGGCRSKQEHDQYHRRAVAEEAERCPGPATCTCRPGHRRTDCPALVGAPSFPCCGGSDEHPPAHTQDCSTRETPSEPSTAEAFATVREQLSAHAPCSPFSSHQRSVAAGLDALSLLERRMGAQQRALRQGISALDSLLGDSDLPDDIRPGVLAMQAMRAALTSSPPVFTIEEVEKAVNYAIEIDAPTRRGVLRTLRDYLAAIRT
jgi:hypothetical protein